MADDRTLTAKIVPFGLRLQPQLKSKLEQEARHNERSLNSEIAIRLEDSLRPGADSVGFPHLFRNFEGDTAAIARVTSRLYEARQPHDVVVLTRDLAARILPASEAAKRNVHDEVLAVLEEKFPEKTGPTYAAVAASLRQVVENGAAELPEPLAAFLDQLERRIAADPTIGWVRI